MHLVCGLLALLILWEFAVLYLHPNRHPDWARMLAAVQREVPPDTLVIFSATGGLELKFGFHDAAMEDYFQRLFHPEHTGLLMLGSARGINGSDRNDSEKVLPAEGLGRPETRSGLRGWSYFLEELTAPPVSGDVVIAVFPPVPLTESRVFRERIFSRGMEVLQLNPWLNVTLKTAEGPRSGGIFAIQIDGKCGPWPHGMVEKSEKIRFYRLR